jgi:integral membrane sensor domain MASE1
MFRLILSLLGLLDVVSQEKQGPARELEPPSLSGAMKVVGICAALGMGFGLVLELMEFLPRDKNLEWFLLFIVGGAALGGLLSAIGAAGYWLNQHDDS